MARKARKVTSSKQSRGTRRQRELLDSSRCRKHTHTIAGGAKVFNSAVTTIMLPDGKYQHLCWECVDDRNMQRRITVGFATDLTTANLLDLVSFA